MTVLVTDNNQSIPSHVLTALDNLGYFAEVYELLCILALISFIVTFFTFHFSFSFGIRNQGLLRGLRPQEPERDRGTDNRRGQIQLL